MGRWMGGCLSEGLGGGLVGERVGHCMFIISHTEDNICLQ